MGILEDDVKEAAGASFGETMYVEEIIGVDIEGDEVIAAGLEDSLSSVCVFTGHWTAECVQIMRCFSSNLGQ